MFPTWLVEDALDNRRTVNGWKPQTLPHLTCGFIDKQGLTRLVQVVRVVVLAV